MGSTLRRTLRAAGGALLAAAAAAGAARAQTGSGCAPATPVLTGPAVVQAGEPYAVSWTNVLGDRAVVSNAVDGYVLQRSLDPNFVTTLDATSTQRSALTLLPPPANATTVYHRVNVR